MAGIEDATSAFSARTIRMPTGLFVFFGDATLRVRAQLERLARLVRLDTEPAQDADEDAERCRGVDANRLLP